MKCMAVLGSYLICVVVGIVYYGLKIIGLAPFSFRQSERGKNALTRHQLFQYSQLGLVYNFLLVPLELYIESSSILSILGRNGSSMFEAINKIVYVLRELTSFAATCLSLIFWGLRQKKAVTILNLLFESSNRLSGLKKQRTKKRLMVLCIIHSTIHLVLWSMLAIKIINYTSFRSFAASTVYVFPIFVIFYYQIQYSAIIEFVAMEIRTINQCFTNHHELNYLSLPSVQNNRLTVASLGTRNNEQLASMRLLRTVRATLIELYKDIADFFSLPILFCVMYSFIAFFYDIYDVLIDGRRKEDWFNNISDIDWIVMLVLTCIYPVTSLSLNVTRAKKEVRLTGKIVNKLLAAARMGSEVRSELERFSRELRHDNDDIFTAYGLFSLDSTLLPSILASTVTYFVILVQLRPPTCEQEHFCNCSTRP